MTTGELTTGATGGTAVEVVVIRGRALSTFWRWIAIIFPSIVLILAVNRVFDFRFFIGFMMDDTTYYFLLVALLLPLAFLHYPAMKVRKKGRAQLLFWFDIAVGVFILGRATRFSSYRGHFK